MSTLFHFEKSESEMSEKNSWKMEKVRINWPKLIAKIGLYTYTTHQGWTFYEIMAVFSPMLLSEICDDKMHAKHAKKEKQAGAELCQAQHSLGKLSLAWNFALAGAVYSASCGWTWKHGGTAA